MMLARYVLVSPEEGIFVGHGLGLAFWSMSEGAGQTTAVTFPSALAAEEFLHDVLEMGPGKAEPKLVYCGRGKYATIDELKLVGLEHLLGELVITTHNIGHA